MKTAALRNALALALGLATATGAAAQDAPTPQQKQELDAARSALDQAAARYAELAARYGSGNADKIIRIERSALRKPVVGVVLAPDERAGVRIAGVTPESAAAAAGLAGGDRLVSIDGKALDATDAEARVKQARERLAALDTKTAVTLGYERAGKAGKVSVTPKVSERVLMVPGGMTFNGNVQVFTDGDGELREVTADSVRSVITATRAHAAEAKARAIVAETGGGNTAFFATVPDMKGEILRLDRNCEGKDCKLPALAEALRWNGLNLAAIDAQLGRYFGTDKGVLVLGTGKDLGGLQAGDVLQKIAGKPVSTPREAMELLRAQPAKGKVAVDYLRDRKPGTAQVGIPEARTFEFSMPKAGTSSTRRIMLIDKDGKTQTWEGGKDDEAPAWVQALPNGDRVEKRVQVIQTKRADEAPASRQSD